MKHIYKYPLVVAHNQVLLLPAGARVLSVQTQGGIPALWAMVDPNIHTLERRIFHVFGTGHTLPEGAENMTFVGTFQLNDGRFVGHLFEDK